MHLHLTGGVWDKLTETESRLDVTKGWLGGMKGSTCYMIVIEFLFELMKTFLETVVMVAKHYE